MKVFAKQLSSRCTPSLTSPAKTYTRRRARAASTYAVAFDIDGVLYRGSQDIASAKSVIEDLQQRNVPVLFLTNGGGLTEAAKVHHLGERLGIPSLTAEQMFQSHTPMKHLEEYKDKLVLAVGKDNAKPILETYGYTNVMTMDELHEQHPAAFPDIVPTPVHGRKVEHFHTPIGAVMAIMDPMLWNRDLQLCCDVLRSNGQIGTVSNDCTQVVPLFMSCPDFEYVTEFPIPRFGSGTFGILLSHLYSKLTNQELNVTWFGKPVATTYTYAARQLNELAKVQGYDAVHRIYAVGDNPESDIQGANGAGDEWTSIMVRTGMFTGEGNHPIHPADVVVEDVGDALEWILEQEESGDR